MDISRITLKILTGMVFLFAVTKFLGKTQISQITPFDFITSIVIGEIFVRGVFEEDLHLLLLIYPILLWGAIIYGIELLAEKSLKLRSFFEGKPVILIRDGQIDRQQMKRNKINLNQLLNLLRQKDVFSVREVKYGILELNGSLSVLRNSPDDQPTREDLNLPDRPVYLPVEIISDGKVLLENLQECGFDLVWLDNQLKTQGVKNIQEVFYGEWLKDKGMYISKKSRQE